MATVQTLPYIAPRKQRKESVRYVVKWIVEDTMYFQWFKRDSAACAFQQRMVDAGYETRLLMHPASK
jgi:hypothetical protein